MKGFSRSPILICVMLSRDLKKFPYWSILNRRLITLKSGNDASTICNFSPATPSLVS